MVPYSSHAEREIFGEQRISYVHFQILITDFVGTYMVVCLILGASSWGSTRFISLQYINGWMCNKNHLEEAMELFHVMENNGLKPNVVIYSIIVDGMCKAGKLDQAKELFYRLSSRVF